MSLRVIKAGILDTVQDAGRFGFRHLGINPTGAMDLYAMQMANILVGNDPHTAVIEMHFPAASFFFEQPTLIAVCGADFYPTLNADTVPASQPILVSKFGILQFEAMKKGARAYLAVKGGFQLTPWLGSMSTQLKAQAGGYKGRPLQKDDEITIDCLPEPFTKLLGKNEYIVLPWKADEQWNEEDHEIRVLPGHEWELLTAASQEKFTKQEFTISTNSDRMGYRLNAKALTTHQHEEIVSSGASCGTIQLLPDGKLILLMADHQTTGGYPRVAHVITAHHPRLAQLKPGDKIHFSMTDLHTAEEMLVKQKQHLQQLQHACTFRLEQYLSK